jgi:hypothetical protein
MFYTGERKKCFLSESLKTITRDAGRAMGISN